MGLFGLGKNKKKHEGTSEPKKSPKKQKSSKKQEDKITAPIIFEDDEKFQKILSNIEFEDDCSDYGVKIGQAFGEVTTAKSIASNRVRLFLNLKNYKTKDTIFKASEGSSGITGKQYKVDCANFSQKLNCKFISAIEKEWEIARLYCLYLYSKDYIEFWRVLQVTALLSGKTDELNLKYLAIFDRLEQALIAIDVKHGTISDRMQEVIIASYNRKLSPDQRVRYQLQMFIEEISRDYSISSETWVVIYKYLNALIARGFKEKLDSKDIQIGYGFTLESGIVKKVEKEEVTSTTNLGEVFGEVNKKQNVTESAEEEEKVDSKFPDSFESISEESEPFSSTDIFTEAKKESGITKPQYIDVDGDESVSKDLSDVEYSIEDVVVGFDDYQRDLSKEDNTSGFEFSCINSDNLIGNNMLICVKMSEMMKAYFSGDSFNAVLRQIYNLNTMINSPHGINTAILQLCSTYNPVELGPDDLDDLMETLTGSDIDLVDFHFSNVLDVLNEVMESKSNRAIFILYDRIIDKTASIRKMRAMSSVFENNKVIFLQLDKDVPNNYEEFEAKEKSLFTNCRHILITPELASSPIALASELREAFIS